MKKEYQVLIVDDQKGIRQLLLETCVLLGYRAMAVASGKESLVLVKKHNFQVALVDMQMPGLSGLKISEQLMAMRKNLKVILMTGYCEFEKEVMEIKARGEVTAVLTKPFALEELKALLAENISE